MIIRPTTRPHTCLRCRRRLAWPFPVSKLGKLYNSSLSATREDSKPNDNHPSFTIRKVGARRPLDTSSKDERAAAQKSSTLSEYPLGKLHGYRGHKLRENQEDLDVNTLGKKAKVLVLRESKYNFFDSKDEITIKPAEHVDIISQLEKERGLVGEEEVKANIEAFRPKQGQEPQTWDDVNEIVRVLQESFNTSQLRRYVDSFSKKSVASTEATATEQKRSAAILNVTEWRPEVSDVDDYFNNSPLRGYSMSSHTNKQRLIMRILRLCWKVDIAEVEDGIGQFEVKIRRRDLLSMNKGHPSRLSQLQNAYLSHDDELLQVLPSRGVLRVTTMRHKRDVFIQILEQELRKTRGTTIFLGDLSPSPPGFKGPPKRQFLEWTDRYFDDAMLLELGHLTSTNIERISQHTLLVSTLKNEAESELLRSSSIDIVKRLLVTACQPYLREERTLKAKGDISAKGKFLPYSHTLGLPWRDKMRRWSRWTLPISKDGNPVSKPFIRDEHEIREVESNNTLPLSSQSAPSDATAELSENLPDKSVTISSAIFGSILHSQAGSEALTMPFASSKTHQTFSTFVPRLVQILQQTTNTTTTTNEIPEDQPVKHITLHLLPSPFQSAPSGINAFKVGDHQVTSGVGAEVLSAFPPIEISFPIIRKDYQSELYDIAAVMNEVKEDVMLPTNGIDLRWEDRTTTPLKRYFEDNESLKNFIKNCTILPARNIYETPPSIKLPIPSELCMGKGLKLLGGDNASVKDVEYMFAGLNIRSTLTFNYHGWQLLYTSIEGGRAGGRTGELRLRPVYNGQLRKGQDFADAVYKLAYELGGSTSDGTSHSQESD